MYELEIYREVMCHQNEEWCKIWKGTDLTVQNWHEEFNKFWPEQKNYRGIIFHDTKEWWKIEEKLTCGLENDMRNLAKFHQNTQKSQNWNFYWALLSKVENAWA